MASYGVTFGEYHIYDTWGLVLKQQSMLTAPEPQTMYIDIPGRNGALDITDSLNGSVAFKDRTLRFTLSGYMALEEWTNVYSDLMDKVHGKALKIVFDEDPDYYYKGRLTVGALNPLGPTAAEIEVTATVGPFKWEMDSASYTGTFAASDVGSGVKVALSGTDASARYWITDLRFGTQSIPTVDFSIYQSIECSYTYQTGSSHTIVFYDGSGASYSVTMKSGGTTTVTIDTLEGAGLDTSTLYRIVMNGGQDGSVAVYTKDCVTMTVEGSPHTTVPVINCTSGVASVTLNGKTVELSAGLNYAEELIMTAGENVLIFSGTFTAATIVVSFTRGWL